VLSLPKVSRPELVVAAIFIASAGLAPAQTISNGSFETNGGAGSSTFSNWTVVTQTNSGGSWYAQSGTQTPVNVFTVPVPPQGVFAAMSDGTGPGSKVLLQSFTVPAGQSSVTLSFNYFRNNVAQSYYVPGPASLDFTNVPNQQARVDILTSGAGPFDVGSTVLQNVFQTNPGDPLMDSVYQSASVNITSAVAAGGTFQLRVAEVDNQGQFEFGVDNIAVTLNTSPGLLQASYGGFVHNRVTGLWSTTITVQNVGGTAVAGPIQVIITNVSSNATMTNPTGTTNGNPYLLITNATLNPGGSANAQASFTNSTNGFITFTPETHSGPLQ